MHHRARNDYRHLQPEPASVELPRHHETFVFNGLWELPGFHRAPLRGLHDDCCTKP